MKCPTKLNKNLRSFHKDEHEDVLKVNNIETNIKRESKRQQQPLLHAEDSPMTKRMLASLTKILEILLK